MAGIRRERVEALEKELHEEFVLNKETLAVQIQATVAIRALSDALAEAADLLDAVYDADDPEHGRYAAWLNLPAVKGAK